MIYGKKTVEYQLPLSAEISGKGSSGVKKQRGDECELHFCWVDRFFTQVSVWGAWSSWEKFVLFKENRTLTITMEGTDFDGVPERTETAHGPLSPSTAVELYIGHAFLAMSGSLLMRFLCSYLLVCRRKQLGKISRNICFGASVVYCGV